jgi:hypothetical protein
VSTDKSDDVAALSRQRIFILSFASIVIGCFAALAVAEVVVRIVRPQQLWELRPDIWIPAEDLGWRLGPNLNTTVNMGVGKVRLYSDADGSRVGPDGPRDGDIKILMLGDSFLAALQVEYEQTFGALLEERLSGQVGKSVRMINTGAVGWGPNRYLTRLRQMGSDWDAILVFFYQGNDVLSVDVDTRRPRQPTRVRNLRWPSSLAQAELVDALAWPVSDFLKERSHLFMLARHQFRYQLMRMGLSASRLHTDFWVSRVSARRWNVTADICKQIQEQAGTTPILFVMLPAAYQVDAEVGESYVRNQGYDMDEIDFNQISRLMIPRFNDVGVNVVDFLPPFRGALSEGYPQTHGTHDTHFNENGHTLTAELLEPLVLELLESSP